jgi:NADPH:quinone reductase-like Zn-dependent oxidoreductase
MKAILHRRFGPPEELQLEENPRPEPAAGEVLVRMRGSCVVYQLPISRYMK